MRVKLTWAGADNEFSTEDDEVLRTDTNHNGHYEFTDLPKGKYQIEVKKEDVEKLSQTHDPSKSKNMNNQYTFELGESAQNNDINFGYKKSSKLKTAISNLFKSGK